MGMLEAMLVIIPDQLAKGNIVEFGSFWLKVNADGAETEEAVRPTQIRRLMPHFKPGKEFKKSLKAVEFKRS
jgi:nucleoid DNA-binding protein